MPPVGFKPTISAVSGLRPGCVNSCTNSPEAGLVGPKLVEIQQYTNKIVTSVSFHSILFPFSLIKGALSGSHHGLFFFIFF